MRLNDDSIIIRLYESTILKPKISLDKIAKKHNVSVKRVQDELKAGIKVELEHTKEKSIAEVIASQHLEEDIDYYKKLKKIEK